MRSIKTTHINRCRQSGSLVPGTVVILALCLPLFAAAPTMADDTQGWTSVSLAGPISDGKLLLWFDGHARFRDDAEELGVTIFRPGLGWRFSDRLSLWGGVARVTVHRDGPDIDEDRIWQQATYRLGTPFEGSLSGRSRLEQRFRDDQGDDTGWRFRQLVRWAKPIKGTNFGWLVWNELFWGLNNADWGQRDGFDQNRALIGVTWKTSDRVRMEAGYLNNLLDTPGGSDRTNHNVSVGVVVGL